MGKTGAAGELIIGIQPGASMNENWWHAVNFAAAANALSSAYGARIEITGTSGESEICSRIARDVPGSVNLAGHTNIIEYAAVISECGLFICNESSAISIASAAGTPVVCLMTGVPELYGPYGVPHRVIQNKPGCYSPVVEHCFCPYGYRCLKDVKPEDVVGAAESLMEEIGSIR
jgi:ADP-heptose:LPS heptosyltransferase